MSAVLTPSAPTAAAKAPPLKVTQGRVVRSESTKFRSLRSTMYTLLVAVVLMIGIGAVFSAVNASQYHTFSVSAKATFQPISTSLTGVVFAVVAFGVLGVLLMSGEYSTGMIRASLTVVPRRLPVLWAKLVVFAVVAFGVLGVLLMSGEYSTGMIRASLTVVPRRLPVLWAKLVVFSSAIFSISLVASFISFFLGQALLSSHHLNVAITAPGAMRSVIGAALYVTVAGLIGVSLGALFRNTAAGIATFAAVFFVLPPLTGLLPASISNHLAPYLPSNAGGSLWGGSATVHNALSPWTGFALLCGYAVVLIAAAAWRLRRADA